MRLPTDLINELRRTLDGEVRLDLPTRVLYSTDASIYQIEPLGVVIPRTQDDLAAAVELAAKYKVPVLPRGSGSSVAGQAVGAALILDCSRWLDRIIAIDHEARTATVEPGVILTHLNQAAGRHGLQFGPDPASAERATMGGVIGNNAAGAHSIIYGMTADHLLAADVILADGSTASFGLESLEDARRLANAPPHALQGAIYAAALDIRQRHAEAIRAHWPLAWRNSAGYRLNYLLPWSPSAPPRWDVGDGYPSIPEGYINLAALLAGSEGTLAVIRRATLRLVSKPAHTVLGVLAFEGVAEACDAVPNLLAQHPSAVELIPRMLIQLARGVPAYARQLGFVNGDPAALLVVEFAGDEQEALEARLRALGRDVLVAASPAEQAHIWNVRKVGLGILDARPAEARPIAFIEDCAIPMERLGEFVRGIERILTEHKTEAAFYAHASAGSLHIRPMVNLKSGVGVRSLRGIAEAVLELSLSLGGSMSSEHGDGLARSEWLRRIYGDQILDAFRVLKQAADPQGILNPGKIVNAPRMDANLRYGMDYQAQSWVPDMDFSRNGGLACAIEQCNGAGVCRQAQGLMCPSFQATREEMHSTRGRANLLRAMITGNGEGIASPPAGARNDIERAVAEALDLCLACKGCKAECPSGVDMAKLKYEFQSHYYRRHRRPLRDYLFAYINPLARMAAPFGGLVNWAARLSFLRKLGEQWLGISAKRRLPTFGDLRLKPQARRPGSRVGLATRSEYQEICLYLPDVFTHYFEPQVERAALAVLATCGVEVKILPLLGAGRTLVSKGFLGAARRQAVCVMDAIRRFDPEGKLPVVGVEPSEIYTLCDEYLDLLPERAAEAQALAGRAWLVDEYLVRPGGGSGKKRKLRVATMGQQDTTKRGPKITLHGHCYQKAQLPAADGYPTGVEASAELLRAVGCEVEVIASGCCGMAGAFGYEAEHYDLSMQMGELGLFPAVRSNLDLSPLTPFPEREGGNEKVLVVAAGSSCRAQIKEGTGVESRHPVEVAAMILGSSDQ